MKNLKQLIKKLSSDYLQRITNIRRQIHSHPELSMQEYKTAELVASTLQQMGIEVETGIAKTGIVGLIKGNNPDKKAIALRADMDALQITEENNVSYKSQNEGIMHACGHDVHTSSLLGTAKILNEIKDQFEGTIKLFFQPSEEIYPGGAIQMIKAKAMENPRPAHVFGQHVYAELEAGKIGLKPGRYMASSDVICLTVKGKGGHGGQPMNNIDPVIIASYIVVALQQIVSRHANPGMPTVLSFGRFIADGRTNIIPNQVKIEGTIRTFDEEWRKSAHQKLTKMARTIAESMGGSCEVVIDPGYPFVYNDPDFTENTKTWAIDYLGEENVVDLELRMTSEDFSYFAKEVPSCFYRIGVRNEERGIVSNLHTPTFDVDEKSLETGMGLMTWFAVKALNV